MNKKLNATTSRTQHNAFLNSASHFPWVVRQVALWGGNSVLQRICRNSHRFNIEIQILVGLVMAHYGSASGKYFQFPIRQNFLTLVISNCKIQICNSSHRLSYITNF
ncbi:hypothetical protein [Leptospira noguchii]|uniref:hypothetical protein n=1 Tax=Leptospira noguchii TaxID=28182 RepID=UPI0018DEDC8B|nr:hypothetical protein [Leptospira noguchii]